MNRNRAFAMQLALAAYMLECPEAFVRYPRDEINYYSGRSRFSPRPPESYLRHRKRVTRSQYVRSHRKGANR